uniref:FZ domain-containing protein n=1 Tax=Strigamia maritima TaxID=126957 RepID=T1JN89_STRMM
MLMLVVLVVISAISSSQCTKCVYNTVPMCQNMGYNLTLFPNTFKHGTQEDVSEALLFYSALMKSNCSQSLAFFLCSLYVPVCRPDYSYSILPCNSLCRKILNHCDAAMKELQLDWPSRIDCYYFPVVDEYNICSEENGLFVYGKKKPLDFNCGVDMDADLCFELIEKEELVPTEEHKQTQRH